VVIDELCTATVMTMHSTIARCRHHDEHGLQVAGDVGESDEHEGDSAGRWMDPALVTGGTLTSGFPVVPGRS
jgi:hypothetical protein